MTSTILKPYVHNGREIHIQFTSDAFFNAVSAAKPFGKSPKDWLRTDETQEYILAIRRKCLLEQNQLVISRHGGDNPGTWLHPKLGVVFARWLSADFAVWADEQIATILSGELIAPMTAQPRLHFCLARCLRTFGLTRDAWERQLLINQIKVLCGQLGVTIPPLHLIGKPADQMQLEV